MAKKTSKKASTLDWLSIGEAAKYLGVSRDTLRRWEKRGKLKSYRTPGGRRRYTIYDLELAMRAPKPTPLLPSKPKPPEPSLARPKPTPPTPKPEIKQAPKIEPKGVESVSPPKPEPRPAGPEPSLARPEPRITTLASDLQSRPIPEQIPPKQPSRPTRASPPAGLPSEALAKGGRLRNLAVNLALILTLLIILPLAVNALLTLLRGPGEILSPLPGISQGF